MDYSEIIIYIIVISIIFISSFKKKKASQSKPENTGRTQKATGDISYPAIPSVSPPATSPGRTIMESNVKVHPADTVHSLNDTVNNSETTRDFQPDIYNDAYNNIPQLNREELRKAIITYEILKTKF